MKRALLPVVVALYAAMFLSSGYAEESGNSFGSAAGKAWKGVKSGSKEAWDGISEGSKEAWEATKEGSGEVWEATKEGVGKVGNSIGDAVSGD
jgi:phage-related tail protein